MALWAFLLTATVIAFVVVHAYVLPKLFLKVRYDYDGLPDRGIRVIGEENGKSIVYEPDVKIRKYIKQYILSERDGKKLFVCKIDDSVRFIDYDVVLFDENGNSFKVLNVKELISKKGYTRVSGLPDKTVYVSLVLNGVNDDKFSNKTSKKVLSKGAALYSLFGAVTEILGILCAKVLLGKLFGGLFFESFVILGQTWIFTALICAGAIAINVLCTLGILFLRRKGTELNG